MARRIEVELLGDSRSLERAFARSERSAHGFDRTLSRMSGRITSGFGSIAGAAGVTFGAAGVVGFLSRSSNAASDLTEALSKNRQIFGTHADAVEAWSRSASEALKISQRAAVEAASGFGGLLQTVGLTGGEAADTSRELVQLGADLASFFNTDVQDALDAIRSGLVGESEPLRRYNVLLSESAVTAEALAETHKKRAAALTQEEKVQARVALVFRQTSAAQGDVARTGDQLAGQERELGARIEDTAAAIGSRLNPMVLEYLTSLNDWLADTRNQKQLQRDVNKLVEGFAGIVEATSPMVLELADAVGTLNDKFKGLKSSIPEGFLKKLVTGTLIEQLKDAGARGQHLLDLLDQAFGAGGKAPASTLGHRYDAIEAARSATARERAQYGTAAPTLPMLGGEFTAQLPAARRGVTAQQRNRWFDSSIARMLDRTQDIPTLRGQIGRLREIAGLIRERIAATKDVTRRLTLEDELVGVIRSIRSDQEQVAAEAQAAAEKQKQKRKETADNLLAWLEFDVDKAGLTKRTSDDLAKLQKLQKAIQKRIHEEGRTLELATRLLDVRKRILALREKQDELGMRATRFQHYSSARLADMLGVGGNRQAIALLAQVGRGGSLPARGGAFAGVVINGPVHVHGVQDVSGFEDAMRKQGRAAPHPRRGSR